MTDLPVAELCADFLQFVYVGVMLHHLLQLSSFCTRNTEVNQIKYY